MEDKLSKTEVVEIFSEFSIHDEILEVKLIPAGWEVCKKKTKKILESQLQCQNIKEILFFKTYAL